MALSQVNIIKQTGGLGFAQLNADAVSGLVMPGVATANLTINTVVEIYSARQLANQYLIDADYDDTNSLLVYHHVSEFFRLAPGAKLWLMLVPVGTTMENIADPDNNFAKKLLPEANGEIFQLAIAGGGALGTLGAGLEADVLAAIPKAQELCDSEFSEYRYNIVLLEGRGYNGTATNATDLRTLNARDVSVVIGQDKDVAALKANYVGYAAIGTALGTVAAAQVHQSIAHVGSFLLSGFDAETPRFLNPAISNNTLVTAFTAADLNTLNDKGYIFCRTFAGYPGVYWNNSPSCIVITDDYRTIELSRTMYKAIRIVRETLLPHLNGPLLPDEVTGRLDIKQKKMFEAQVKGAIEAQMRNNIAEVKKVLVDPASNEDGVPYPPILNDNTLRCIVAIIPYGKAEQIIVTIGYTNPSA